MTDDPAKLLGDGSAAPGTGTELAQVIHPSEIIPAEAILSKRIRPLSTCGSCPRLVTTYVPPVEVQRGCRDSADAPADIVFVMTQPDVDRDRHGAPMSLPGIPGETRSVFQRALRILMSEDSARAKTSVVGIFAAACTPVVPREKPRAAVLHQCHPHVKKELDALEPALIVAFGAESLKQLGISRKHSDVRGRILESHETGLPQGTGVLVTFSDAAVAAAPGLYRTFEQDLRNGYKWLASGGADSGEDLEEYNAAQRAEIDEKFKRIVAGHKFAVTVEDVVAICDEIVNYVEILPDGRVGPGTIAIDTETTSLHAEKEGSRLIAFCFSWGEGLSTAFRFDHPFAPQEYLDRLPELIAAVARVLACPKPKTLHNAKFDLKWIELAYGMPVANVAWCSMCGEHLLDEDKKGHYGLKSLTTAWLPELSGYEDRLDEHVPQRADQNEVEWHGRWPNTRSRRSVRG
jgi:uracil-DNA glycosylase family 4